MLVPKVLPALLIALLPLAAQPVTVQPAGSAEATESRTVPLASGSTLKVTNVNGHVKVQAWDKAEVQFTGTFKPSSEGEQVKVILEPVAGGLEIRGVYPQHHGWGAYHGPQCEMTLQVPRQVRPSLETVNGAVELTGTQGQARLATVNGGVCASSLTEALDAHTVNGAITLDGVAGTLNLRTVNGAIHGSGLSGTRGGIQARTVNGAIQLQVGGLKGRLEASTVNGHITFKAPGAEQVEVKKHHVRAVFPGGEQTIRLHTVNGGITLE